MCLVCRHISDIAFPHLYRDLDLPYYPNDPEWKKLQPLYGIRGLQYVQTIRLEHCEFADTKYCDVLSKLLPKLRPDSLKDIEFGTHGRSRREHLDLLRRTQANMASVEVDLTDTVKSPLYSQAIEEPLRTAVAALESQHSVKQFSLTINSHTDLLTCGLLLPVLKTIEIKGLALRLTGESRGQGIEDYETSPPVHDLFSRCIPSTLVQLSLTYIALPIREPIQLDSFPSLADLKVISCANVLPIIRNFRDPKLSTCI